jgi:hypothetical protein
MRGGGMAGGSATRLTALSDSQSFPVAMTDLKTLLKTFEPRSIPHLLYSSPLKAPEVEK